MSSFGNSRGIQVSPLMVWGRLYLWAENVKKGEFNERLKIKTKARPALKISRADKTSAVIQSSFSLFCETT